MRALTAMKSPTPTPNGIGIVKYQYPFSEKTSTLVFILKIVVLSSGGQAHRGGGCAAASLWCAYARPRGGMVRTI